MILSHSFSSKESLSVIYFHVYTIVKYVILKHFYLYSLEKHVFHVILKVFTVYFDSQNAFRRKDIEKTTKFNVLNL